MRLRFICTVILTCLAYPLYASAESFEFPIVGGVFEYTVQPGDYLIKIGARFGVEATALTRDNGLKYEALLKPGQKLIVENQHIVPETREDGLLINLPQRMLYYFRDWNLVAAYPVGLGKPSWPTPTGAFSVIDKATNKSWLVPKSIQEEMRREGQVVKTEVPPGPDNPLGMHWIGLSLSSIGIHGTIAPSSVYHFQSHGCIRLHPADIEALFKEVDRGTTGIIIYAPLLLTESDERVFLEVHQDVYLTGNASLKALEQLANDAMLSDRIDWSLATTVLEQHEGVARDVTLSYEIPLN